MQTKPVFACCFFNECSHPGAEINETDGDEARQSGTNHGRSQRTPYDTVILGSHLEQLAVDEGNICLVRLLRPVRHSGRFSPLLALVPLRRGKRRLPAEAAINTRAVTIFKVFGLVNELVTRTNCLSRTGMNKLQSHAASSTFSTGLPNLKESLILGR